MLFLSFHYLHLWRTWFSFCYRKK